MEEKQFPVTNAKYALERRCWKRILIGSFIHELLYLNLDQATIFSIYKFDKIHSIKAFKQYT